MGRGKLGSRKSGDGSLPPNAKQARSDQVGTAKPPDDQ